jgi:hypothetical protein
MVCLADRLTELVPSTVSRSGLSDYYKGRLLDSTFSLTINPHGKLVVSTSFVIPWSQEFTSYEEEEYEDLKDRLNWVLFTIEEALD